MLSAVMCDRADVVEVLLGAGADLHAKDNVGVIFFAFDTVCFNLRLLL